MPENRFAKYRTPSSAPPAAENRFAKYRAQKPAVSEGRTRRDEIVDDFQEDFKSGHGPGVALRAGLEGISMPAALPGNLAVMGINAATGSQIKTPSQGFAEMLTDWGVPEPEDDYERLGSALVSGGSGGALLGPAAILPGMTGAGAGELAREAGAPGWAQFVASLVGGGAPGMAKAIGSTAKTAAGTVGSVIKPFRRAGQEDIVGQVLNREATNPATAVENMKTAPEFVPGSKPTAGPASKDPGLLGLERGMRNRKPTDFADVDTAQQQARNAHLDEIAKQPEDIVKAKTARTEAGNKSRTSAFENAQPASVAGTKKAIKGIKESPEGVRDAVSKSMRWARKKINDAVDPKIKKEINKLTGQLETADDAGKAAIKKQIKDLRGKIDPQRLYAARQDIADAITGKFDSEQPALKLASKELSKVRDALDADIEAGAPGYKQYLEDFREQSKPIEQMEILQDMRTRGEVSVPNPVTGERTLSQAKWNNLVNKNADYKKVLTPEQTKRVENIAADLDRGASLESFKATGSATVQNMTMSNILGGLVSGQRPANALMRSVARPLEWIYKVPEEDMQILLLEAMKDPQTAAQLMSKASPQASEALSRRLQSFVKKTGKDIGKGAAIGTAMDNTKNQDSSKN
jgi:hypothetical protein